MKTWQKKFQALTARVKELEAANVAKTAKIGQLEQNMQRTENVLIAAKVGQNLPRNMSQQQIASANSPRPDSRESKKERRRKLKRRESTKRSIKNAGVEQDDGLAKLAAEVEQDTTEPVEPSPKRVVQLYDSTDDSEATSDSSEDGSSVERRQIVVDGETKRKVIHLEQQLANIESLMEDRLSKEDLERATGQMHTLGQRTLVLEAKMSVMDGSTVPDVNTGGMSTAAMEAMERKLAASADAFQAELAAVKTQAMLAASDDVKGATALLANLTDTMNTQHNRQTQTIGHLEKEILRLQGELTASRNSIKFQDALLNIHSEKIEKTQMMQQDIDDKLDQLQAKKHENLLSVLAPDADGNASAASWWDDGPGSKTASRAGSNVQGPSGPPGPPTSFIPAGVPMPPGAPVSTHGALPGGNFPTPQVAVRPSRRLLLQESHKSFNMDPDAAAAANKKKNRPTMGGGTVLLDANAAQLREHSRKLEAAQLLLSMMKERVGRKVERRDFELLALSVKARMDADKRIASACGGHSVDNVVIDMYERLNALEARKLKRKQSVVMETPANPYANTSPATPFSRGSAPGSHSERGQATQSKEMMNALDSMFMDFKMMQEKQVLQSKRQVLLNDALVALKRQTVVFLQQKANKADLVRLSDLVSRGAHVHSGFHVLPDASTSPLPVLGSGRNSKAKCLSCDRPLTSSGVFGHDHVHHSPVPQLDLHKVPVEEQKEDPSNREAREPKIRRPSTTTASSVSSRRSKKSSSGPTSPPKQDLDTAAMTGWAEEAPVEFGKEPDELERPPTTGRGMRITQIAQAQGDGGGATQKRAATAR
mmetsp:Transcript_27799/g.64122  ORF Transcript_27799/g.64122 Transcript_27799/m.64122 type:complete len:824 (-) Transcript_27799:412-2883(-)